MIYLDNAATSFQKPKEVQEAVKEALIKYTANSGRGAYRVARDSLAKVFEARETATSFFGENKKCIFTPGCSYALNLAIRGCLTNNAHIIITSLEHNSVIRVVTNLVKEKNIQITILDDISEENIIRAMRPNTKLVITTHVSNVTGERVDIKKVASICKRYGVKYLVDTAQGAGHLFDDFSDVDMVAFAGHKGLKGLSGVGGLMIKKDIELKPVIFGGTGTKSLEIIQPSEDIEDFEVGTQPIIPIISLNAGMKYVLDNKDLIVRQEEYITKYMIDKLTKLDFISTYFDVKNCYGVFSFNIKGVDSSIVADCLDEEFDIAVRSGFMCAPLIHKKLGTENLGVVRASISERTSVEDVDNFIFALKQINKKF